MPNNQSEWIFRMNKHFQATWAVRFGPENEIVAESASQQPLITVVVQSCVDSRPNTLVPAFIQILLRFLKHLLFELESYWLCAHTLISQDRYECSKYCDCAIVKSIFKCAQHTTSFFGPIAIVPKHTAQTPNAPHHRERESLYSLMWLLSS